MKLAAPSHLAHDRQLAAHQPDQAPRDREPQAGPAVTPRHRRVGLGELLEDRRQLIARDADARVADAEPQVRLLVAHPHGRHRDDHLTGLGELDPVADQVREHLPQPGRVAAHHVRGLARDVRDELELLFPSAHREQGDDR